MKQLNKRNSIEEIKSKPLETDSIMHGKSSKFAKESDSMTHRTPMVFKRDNDSILNKQSIDTSAKEVVNEKTSKSFNPHKPFYKSIIAITAAIVLQNFWRDYLTRKMNKSSQLDTGKSVLDLLKKKIQNNTTYFNDKSDPNEVEKEDAQHQKDKVVEQLFDEAREDLDQPPKILSHSVDDKSMKESQQKGTVYK